MLSTELYNTRGKAAVIPVVSDATQTTHETQRSADQVSANSYSMSFFFSDVCSNILKIGKIK